jgi:protein SCO1
MTLHPSKIRITFLAVFCLLVVSCLCGGSVLGKDDALPERLDGVGIEEHLDAEIPLDVKFMDDRGGITSFRELLKDGNPILLTLNYSDCPGLCVAQLNGLVNGINNVASLDLGKDFKMVSLSINPQEARERAASTKKKYSDDLKKHHRAEGWHFLVGTEPDIQAVAEAVGFHYTYDAKHKRYNHSAAAILISPKGHVTRYLYEVGFTGETLKMALVEAGQGKIGSMLDAFVLNCFHYDANENRYSANAKTILSLVAGLFVTVGVVASLPFWISWRRGRATISHAPTA